MAQSINIPSEITAWSQNLPAWQRDALRRLVVNGSLNDQDTNELYLQVKGENGIPDTENQISEPIPLSLHHFTAHISTDQHIVLLSLRNLQNVNALCPDQDLTFNPKGITIIYGWNASGKSGYARVLKRACRARGENESILPDVFSTALPAECAKATIELSVDGVSKIVNWTEDDAPSPYLSDVQVFDSKCARVFINDNNKVEVIPYGLDIFKKLSDLCTVIEVKIRNELSIVDSTAKMYPISDFEGTSVYTFIDQISHQTKKSEVERLASIKPGEIKQQEIAQKTLSELKRTDPSVQSALLRKKKKRIARIRTVITSALDQLTVGETLISLHKSYIAAKEAAEIARAKAFADQPIKSTGSDSWKNLFDAARAFSTEQAYPDKEFPFVGEGAYCLLCQQTIKQSAAQRLIAFNDFLINKTEELAKSKLKEYDFKKTQFHGITIHAQSDDDQELVDLMECEPALAKTVKSFWTALRQRSAAYQRALISHSPIEFGRLPNNPVEKLSSLEERLEMEAKIQDELIDPARQIELEISIKEFKARQWVAKNKAVILGDINKLRYRQALQKCLSSTSTTNITKFGSALTQKAITDNLRTTLTNEIKYLGIDRGLDFRKSAKKGETYHQLGFPEVVLQEIKISDILSEGEERAVAIACFLSELSLANRKCGIIFDDPITSLDHRIRERVAKRLVEEAKLRQVIIFTHDICFRIDLESFSLSRGIDCKVETIYRTTNKIGLCPKDKGKLWDDMSVGQKIEYLQRIVTNARKDYEADDLEAYGDKIIKFYDFLRNAWECAVEESLLHGIVKRYRRSVQTLHIKKVRVTKEDTDIIFQAMTDVSDQIKSHSQARERQQDMAVPAKLDEDLDTLRSFVKSKKGNA